MSAPTTCARSSRTRLVMRRGKQKRTAPATRRARVAVDAHGPRIGAYRALRIIVASVVELVVCLFCGVPLPSWTISGPSDLLLFHPSCRNRGSTYPSRSAPRSHPSRTGRYGRFTTGRRRYDLSCVASVSLDVDIFVCVRTTGPLYLCLSLTRTRLPRRTYYHSPRMPFGSFEQFGIPMSLNSWKS